MSIKRFIQNEIFLPRLRETGVLVVYDPDRRYRDLCRELAMPTLCVVDASESSIESREAALAALQELGTPHASLQALLVYVPAPRPLDEEAQQQDPFALYAACGRVFPYSDGDEYVNLCLRAKADHATEIRRIFQHNPNPDFAVIDAVGSGQGWPQLATLLAVESARELLFALLVPTPTQLAALKAHDTWLPEAKELLHTALGLKLMTRAKSWSPIADELWRFLLFSEFAFDLPEALPAALATVPSAPPEAQPLVNDLCDRLRNDRRTQDRYIQRAETVEQELNLPPACRAITDLGSRDTFPFEERSFFAQAVQALTHDDPDRLRTILSRHARSIWGGRGENQSRWQLIQSAARLLQACDDASGRLRDHSRTQSSLIDFYLSTLRHVDRLQREFEQAATEAVTLDDHGHDDQIRRRCRTTYRALMDDVQTSFINHLAADGWPPPARQANADLFDRIVAPLLQNSGRRVALLLIDALRYELGVELEKQLGADHDVTLTPAFASLPSVTAVGMASLLPGAGQTLTLHHRDSAIVPTVDDQVVANVAQRMALLSRRYGQRFHETGLLNFVRDKIDLPATVDLLAIRSNEMDSEFESNPETALHTIVRTFQQIQRAIHKLRTLGFQDAIIFTDHGFFLNTATGPGDTCPKPPGTWTPVHDRLLLGEGAHDTANWVMPAPSLAIRSNFASVAGPRAMVAYQSGKTYLHGGASLQETVVPVLQVRLQPAAAQSHAPQVTLRYKRGGPRITTRLPVIEVSAAAADLFSLNNTIEVLLEAQDKQGDVVGEARLGDPVNPATLTLSLQPGDTVQVTMKMSLDFNGKFTIKALDPATRTTFHTLDLETDYTV